MHPTLHSTLSQYDKIILVGGGTGGHIQPIVSLVRSLDKGVDQYLWIGGSDSTEEITAISENIHFRSIPTLKLSTTRSPKILFYPFVLIRGIYEARKILSKIQQSSCMFSKGGPGSVAIGLAAWSLYIPLYIHESDTVPGRSNRILGKFADIIFLGFESAKQYFNTAKCEVIGQILDPVFDLQHSNTPTLQHSISWQTTKPHILVICGSQGSQVIFEEIIKNYSGYNEYEWIISLGKLNSNMKSEFEKISDCQALEWISQLDIAQLIQDTDIAITRGSATTLAELTVFGTNPKLIIIPLPYSAGNHQYYNALEYAKSGHILLEQKNLNQLTEIITQHVGHNS